MYKVGDRIEITKQDANSARVDIGDVGTVVSVAGLGAHVKMDTNRGFGTNWYIGFSSMQHASNAAQVRSHIFNKGDRVTVKDPKGHRYGETFTFDSYSADFQYCHLIDPLGRKILAEANAFVLLSEKISVVKLINVPCVIHDWKLVPGFRFDHMECINCSAKREFDKERDTA
jgi:hypothetical protein